VALRIVCMCGYVIQGGSDDELWANAQEHMGVLHPELVGNVTREDILAQAEVLGQALRPGAAQQPLVNGAQGRVGRDAQIVPEQDP
jgi:predicted small metal-binding protein